MANKPYVDIYSGLLLEDKSEVQVNNITYTASEPIDIKNHNFNLKIDNQTLQINASGQLVANLDELGNEVNIIANTVASLENNKADINLSNISEAGKRVIHANAGTPDNMVTTDTEQEIEGNKIFTNEQLTIGSEDLDKAKLLFQTANATLEGIGLDYSTNESIINIGSSLGKTVIKGSTITDGNGNTMLSTANMPIATTNARGTVRPDGQTITISASGVISAIGTASHVEKYGIRGDYATQYGILECPNGILEIDGMNVTLQPMVVMQCAGQESKTTITGKLKHTITSNDDIDLFYAGGQLLECGDVFYQEAEPDNGVTNYLAWWKPSLGKWQFKSNDTGNVWKEAVACRLAHIHTDGNTITRVDYIGNRILDDEIFALQSDVDTALANKADKTELPVENRLLKGTSLYPISNLATDATLAQTIQKVNEIIAVLVNRGIARIQ